MVIKMTTYSAEELEQIRSTLPDGFAAFEKKTQRSRCPMVPFEKMKTANPDLYQKISRDLVFRRYWFLGFLPEVYPLVYDDGTEPEVAVGGKVAGDILSGRGLVALVNHPAKKLIVKSLQSKREAQIALAAANIGVGPRQYKSVNGFLTEDFVDGEPFTRLAERKLVNDRLYLTGRRIGEMLTLLHLHGIYYNDTNLADDIGRSHVIVPDEEPATLIDYGVAIKLDRYPDLDDNEVYDLFRTMPGLNLLMPTVPSADELDYFTGQFRPKIRELSREQIFDRDRYFVEEGLGLLTRIYGRRIVEPFLSGFRETYHK